MTRNVDNLIIADSLSPPNAAVHSGKRLEHRHNAILREPSSGTVWGEPPQPRGTGLWIPEEGDAGRVSRIAAKLRRNDVDELADEPTPNSDLAKLEVFTRARRWAIPR